MADGGDRFFRGEDKNFGAPINIYPVGICVSFRLRDEILPEDWISRRIG